jgi:anti-sigma factor RsiW
MNHEETSHEACVARLSDYLDGHLGADERAEVERHLGACSACATVAGELEAVRARARTLGPIAPPRDLWPAIRARLGDAEVVPLTRIPEPRRARRIFRFTGPQLAAAGLALALATGAGGWSLRSLGAGEGALPAEAGAGGAAVGADVGAQSVATGSEPLAAELRELERTLDRARDRLDPNTLRILEKNLAVIERAIEESVAALEVDPGNAYVEGHLRASLERKRTYLREAARLAEWSS